MNEWDQRIREHRVWVEMKTLGPAIDTALSIEDLAPETVAGLERLREILAYCGKRLAAAEPLITHPQPLESIAINFASVQNELTAFASDKDPGHVVNANIAADAALLPIAQLPGAYSPEEVGALVSVITDYRAIVQQALASAKGKLIHFNSVSEDSLSKLTSATDEGLAKLNSRLDESSKGLTATAESLQATLSQLATSIQSEQQKLTQIVTDQQGQFSTAQETRSKEFSDNLRVFTENLNKIVADYQGQFSSGQDTRSKEFTLAESTRQTKYNEAINEYVKKLAEQNAEFTKERAEIFSLESEALGSYRKDYEEKASEILHKVQKQQGHVEKLVGVIGNLGVTSGYLRAANRAQRGMWLWQVMTVGAMGVLSYTAYKTLGLLEYGNGRFNWGGFAARALLLASLGLIAAYSSSQADKLFGDERRNRKLALELEAIGPYLAPLPEEDQHKFRIEIGGRSFGREQDLQPGTHHKSPASLLDLVKSKESKDLLDLAIDLVKKAKDLK